MKWTIQGQTGDYCKANCDFSPWEIDPGFESQQERHTGSSVMAGWPYESCRNGNTTLAAKREMAWGPLLMEMTHLLVLGMGYIIKKS
jgi:hypothetical protein